MDEDSELLWPIILSDGHRDLTDEERTRVTLWVAGRFAAASFSDFLIETAAEADKVEAFANYWIDRGKPQLAVPLARLSLTAHDRISGPEAPSATRSVGILALALTEIDAKENIPPLRREAYALIERYRQAITIQFGESDTRLAEALLINSRLAKADGKTDEAADFAVRAFTHMAAAPERSLEAETLAGWLLDLDPSKAAKAFRAELDRLDALTEAPVISHLDAIRRVLRTMPQWQDLGETGRLYERAQELAARAHGEESAAFGEAIYEHGRFRSLYEDRVLGERLLRRALALFERLEPCPIPALARTLHQLALVRAAEGDREEAEALLRRTVVLLRKNESGNEAPLVAAALDLGGLIQDQGRWGQAEAQFMEAFRIAMRLLGEDARQTENARKRVARFRRDWLVHHEGGKLFGMSHRHLAAACSDRFELSVRMLFDVAQYADTSENEMMLIAAGATLLARNGQVMRAIEVVERNLNAAIHEWDGAAVYAHAARIEHTVHGVDAAREVIRRAVAHARRVHVHERLEDAALDDLLTALEGSDGDDLIQAALALVREVSPIVALRWDIRRQIADGDLDGAWKSFQSMGSIGRDSGLVCDLLQKAGKARRTDIVCGLTEMQAVVGLRHHAVKALLETGACDLAAVLTTTLTDPFERSEAASFMARAAGEANHTDSFDRWAADLISLCRESQRASFQSTWALAEGALALMGAEQAMLWAERSLPEERRESFLLHLTRCLIDSEQVEGVKALVARFGSDTARGYVEEDITRWTKRQRDRVIQTKFEAELAAERIDVAATTLMTFENAWFAVEASVMLAKAAVGEDVLVALCAGLDALTGRYVDEVFKGLGKEHFRYQAAQQLGEAACSLLDEMGRVRFADAAFARAATLDDLPRGATLVIAAGEASMGVSAA